MTEQPSTDLLSAEQPSAERPSPPQPARQRRAKPRSLPTVMAALAVFAVAFEFLAFQLSAGKDPAVGPGTTASAPVVKARPAKKLVITRVIPAGNGPAGASSSTSSSSGSVAAQAPVTTSSS
jgi:hypothetical protein